METPGMRMGPLARTAPSLTPDVRSDVPSTIHRSASLVDVLDRVLDKGLAIAGDIKISLAEVELLTIRIRLLICSIDKAQQIGLDWWKYDANLSPRNRRSSTTNDDLRRQIRLLERRVAALAARRVPARVRSRRTTRSRSGTRR